MTHVVATTTIGQNDPLSDPRYLIDSSTLMRMGDVPIPEHTQF